MTSEIGKHIEDIHNAWKNFLHSTPGTLEDVENVEELIKLLATYNQFNVKAISSKLK